MANKKNTQGNERIYSFSCVTYCTPEDCMNVLRQHDIKAAWMMLHDKDVDDDGKPKGKHLHFVIRTLNAHTFDAVRKWFNGVKDAESGQQVNVRVEQTKGSSERGAVRYLAHLDNPEKAQYNPGEITCFNALSRRQLQDYQCDDGEEGRQHEVIMAYADYEISLKEAMKLCPELFIHKYASICALVRDLRAEAEWEMDKKMAEWERTHKQDKKEESCNG